MPVRVKAVKIKQYIHCSLIQKFYAYQRYSEYNFLILDRYVVCPMLIVYVVSFQLTYQSSFKQ